VWVVALGIQNAMCMLSSTVFPTLSHKWHDFQTRYWTCIECFDFLYNICLKHFWL